MSRERLRSSRSNLFKGDSLTQFPKISPEMAFFRDFEEFVNSKSQMYGGNKRRNGMSARSITTSQAPSTRASSAFTTGLEPTIAQSNASLTLKVNELTPQVSKTDAIKKNISINQAIKKTKNKIKFTAQASSEKFENKMQIFKGLSTFIDVKDAIRNMNAMNHVPSPHMETLKQANMKSKANLRATFSQRRPASVEKPAFGELDYKIRNALASAREHVRTARASPRKKVETERNYFNRYSSANHTKIVESQKELYDPDDKNDLDFFYNKLGADLASGQLWREEAPMEYDENEVANGINYLKLMLAEKTKNVRVDAKFENNFKQRANNVITLMKRTAKKIFDKNLKTAKEIALEEQEKIKEAKRAERLRREEKLRLQQEAQEFFDTHLNQQDPFGVEANLDQLPIEEQLNHIRSRINGLEKSEERPKSFSGRRPNRARSINQLPEVDELATNRQINSLHRKYTSTIIDGLNHHIRGFQDTRFQLERELEELDVMYEKDVEKIKEDPLESLRINFDSKTHFGTFLNKPARLGPLKKNLAVVLGV